MTTIKPLARIAVAALAVALLASSCLDESPAAQDAVSGDADVANDALERFQETQPAPVFPWSQLRQNLIELNTAQAQTTATTTFFFNMGVTEPIAQCSSIGFPIPSTAQLTNPEQPLRWTSASGGDSAVTLPLPEQTGVYTGDSTGTYVICTDAEGRAYADYWEGFVKVVTGNAEWRDGQVVLLGAPTFDFSEGR